MSKRIYYDAVEREADRLLKEAGALGRGTGIYTEKQLTRRNRRECVNSELAALTLACAEVELTQMVLADLQRLGRMAKLTECQQDVWNLRILGLSQEEIAEVCKITPQAVSDRLIRARVRVIKAMFACPYFGIWEVYYQLLRRRRKKTK